MAKKASTIITIIDDIDVFLTETKDPVTLMYLMKILRVKADEAHIKAFLIQVNKGKDNG